LENLSLGRVAELTIQDPNGTSRISTILV